MATIQSADERAFSFLRVNERQPKPGTEGISEIRGPYYNPMGTRPRGCARHDGQLCGFAEV
jgi:hypothetical protein